MKLYGHSFQFELNETRIDYMHAKSTPIARSFCDHLLLLFATVDGKRQMKQMGWVLRIYRWTSLCMFIAAIMETIRIHPLLVRTVNYTYIGNNISTNFPLE